MRGIDNGWEGTDPFRPDPRWLAPDVVAFGDRLLVVWNDSNAVRFRVGRLEDLATVESQWLVETFAPEPGSHLSPRSISYPDIVLNGRGGVALLQLHERDPMGATFLLRFEGDAPPSALVPGTP